MRALAVTLALALCLAGTLAACSPEDPAPLEAERAKLLETTVPRDDYWREVERKGSALRAQRAAEQRSARAATEKAQLSAALEQLRTSVADAKRVNAQVEQQLAGLDQEAEKLRARQRELQSFLARTGPPDVGAPKP
jgi:predicted  nucleic acid-binding Zn-ribbon protein